jgi:pectate lyase
MRQAHRRGRLAVAMTMLAAAGLSVTTSLTTAGTAQAATGCAVTYTVTNSWPGGFGASVDVKNLGDAVDGWTVQWSFTSGQTISSGWNGTFSQSGSSVTVTNSSWNAALGTGATASLGFNGTLPGSANAVPSSFTLNGTTCTGTPTTTPTSAGPTSPAPTSAAPTSAAPTTTRPTTAPVTTTTTTAPSTGTPNGVWPTSKGNASGASTIKVTGSLDGGMKRYCCIGDGGQSESQDPMFELSNGATLSNVIIGSPAGDGVHCLGTCTLNNVWWEDVGEDAATFKGTSASQTMTINGGGARSASDKVFQHNGPGTMVIKNFYVDNFGKLYRSCGNCTTSYKRDVVVDNILVKGPGKSIVGINTNFGDTARLSRIVITNDSSRKISICDKYRGVPKGSEPTLIGSGPDGTNCLYTNNDISYR